jgi:hypothetical protein
MHLDRTHTWTPADLDLLARLIRRRWPASRIAPVFSVTRNAVLGKIHRHDELKLLMPKRSPKKPPADKWVKPLKLKKDKENKVLEPDAEKPDVPPQQFHVKPEVPHPMLLVPLGNLGANQCRWPVKSDPNVTGFHLFCGRPTPLGEVYCAEHRARSRAKQ